MMRVRWAANGTDIRVKSFTDEIEMDQFISMIVNNPTTTLIAVEDDPIAVETTERFDRRTRVGLLERLA